MLVLMTFEVGILFAGALGLGLGKFILCFLELPKPLESNSSISVKWKTSQDLYEPNPDPCCNKLDEFTSAV